MDCLRKAFSSLFKAFVLICVLGFLLIIVFCFSLWSETMMPDSWYFSIVEKRVGLTLPQDCFQNVSIDWKSSRDYHMEMICTVKSHDSFKIWYTHTFDPIFNVCPSDIQDLYPILSETTVSKLKAFCLSNSCLWYVSNRVDANRDHYDIFALCMLTDELVYVGYDK